jgi:hypothetical protein
MYFFAWLFCVAVWFFAIICMVFMFTDEDLPRGSYLGILGLSFALGSVVFGLTYLADTM